MAISIAELRERLKRLSWGDGLTRDEIYNQWDGMPDEVFEKLPPDYRFTDADGIMSYLAHLAAGQPIETSPYGAPPEYGPSPTAIPARESDTTHGIGSGVHEESTGSEAQTGAYRDGVSPPKRKDPDYPLEEEE